MQQQATQQQPGFFRGYGGSDEMPLQGYAALLGLWQLFFAIAYALTRQQEGRHTRYTWSDFALLALATHKLSRIITHDWVTAPVRAPFVRYKESTGSGEVREEARHDGPFRQAVGDLLTCNWCIGPWVATGLVGGMAVAPRFTRTLATTFALVAVSDFLHEGYGMMKQQYQHMASSNGSSS